ncbi:LOW QUALITY PROTEIN: hypothetical protein TorRG33x02_284360 [Trema orientale]|uniref:Uncharacterized protein n=1 Tax=Trema orientale TaxID=63057 RepID=A0A2P5CHX4_TREOI|nr:LOW QUALITY PROTEIN: hypothetical protein TorRG33x02_284360 [Trema orientale]
MQTTLKNTLVQVILNKIALVQVIFYKHLENRDSKNRTSKWRGSRLPSKSTGIFSSPSANTVCVVNEKILQTMPHALLQSKFSSSTRTLMTSDMASDG